MLIIQGNAERVVMKTDPDGLGNVKTKPVWLETLMDAFVSHSQSMNSISNDSNLPPPPPPTLTIAKLSNYLSELMVTTTSTMETAVRAALDEVSE